MNYKTDNLQVDSALLNDHLCPPENQNARVHVSRDEFVILYEINPYKTYSFRFSTYRAQDLSTVQCKNIDCDSIQILLSLRGMVKSTCIAQGDLKNLLDLL